MLKSIILVGKHEQGVENIPTYLNKMQNLFSKGWKWETYPLDYDTSPNYIVFSLRECKL